MTNSHRLATIRDRLIRWIADEHGRVESSDSDETSAPPIVSESILIRDEFYCGRRFDLGTHRAVWFFEQDELKIFRKSGKLECILTGDEISLPPACEAAPNDILQMPTRSDAANPVSGERKGSDGDLGKRDLGNGDFGNGDFGKRDLGNEGLRRAA